MVPHVFHIRPRVFHQTPRFPPDSAFSTGPRVFYQTPRFPLDPAFSTRPRIFHTPGPRTPYPAPRDPGPAFSTYPRAVNLACSPLHSQMFEIFATKLRRSFTCVISFDLSTAINKSVPNYAAKLHFCQKNII